MRSKSAEPMARALAGTFDHKQAVVDLAGLADQLGQVLGRERTVRYPTVC